MLRARLFGDLTVWVDDRPVPPIPALRPRSVLGYLLLHPGLHPRTRLAGRFWPDVFETSARASLRSALWAVRSALDAVGGGAYLYADRSSVGIAPDMAVSVDAREFDRLLVLGDAVSLDAAYRLSGGPLLADLADEWVLDAQDAHRARLAELCMSLATLAEASGDLAAAVRWTQAALSHDRLSEATHRALMRRLGANGERAQALAAYRRARAVLATELGVAPSRETRELAEELREGGRDEAEAQLAATPPAPAATPIVGREAELAELQGWWRAAQSASGGVLTVTGEAGIGKSRLVDELITTARPGGVLVARGSVLAVAGAPPLGPWTDAIRDLVNASDAAPVGATWPAELARLSPIVGSRWGVTAAAPSATPDLERSRLFEAVTQLVAWCANERPVLIVLEDLQWSDPTSLALLAHVGRQLDMLRVLLIVTRRHAPGSAELDLSLDAIRRRGALRAEVNLSPLTPDQTRTIVCQAALDLPDQAVERLVALAAGNPLFAGESARAVTGGGDPAEGLKATLRARLAGLPAAAAELILVVAAAGRPLGLAEAAAALGADGLLDTFDAAVAAGILRLSDDRRVSFVHDLIRRAVEIGASEAGRAEAHRRLATALVGHPDRSNAEMARHLRLAGDTAAARRFLVAAAADAKSIGALDEAVSNLREALELTGAGDRGATDLWLALADVCAWRGDRLGMDQAFDRAAEILEQVDDQQGLATAFAFRARWLHTTLCYPHEALVAAHRALDLSEGMADAIPEARVLAIASAAWAEAVAGDPSAAEALIDTARRSPDGVIDREMEAELEHVRGNALVRSGRFVEGAQTCAQAAELAQLAGRTELAALAMLTAACSLACTGDLPRVLRLLGTAATWPSPGRSLEMQLRAARAYTLSRAGRAAEAEAAGRENLEVASRTGDRRDQAVAAFDLGSILLAHGTGEEAARFLTDALATGDAPLPRALARLRLAEALLVAGDTDDAEQALGDVPFEPVRAADFPQTLVAHLSRLQGLIAAARSDTKLATRRLREAERVWHAIRATPPSGDAYAAVLVDLGRPPVGGLIEPERELARLQLDLAALATPQNGES